MLRHGGPLQDQHHQAERRFKTAIPLMLHGADGSTDAPAAKAGRQMTSAGAHVRKGVKIGPALPRVRHSLANNFRQHQRGAQRWRALTGITLYRLQLVPQPGIDVVQAQEGCSSDHHWPPAMGSTVTSPGSDDPGADPAADEHAQDGSRQPSRLPSSSGVSVSIRRTRPSRGRGTTSAIWMPTTRMPDATSWR